MIKTPPSLICLFAVASCGSNERGVSSFSGSTDAAMLQFFKTVPEKARVRITSIGGRESIALSIAEKIEAKKISLIVDDYCLSSCAQYLIPASEKTMILQDSLVAFHTNSYGGIAIGIISKGSKELDQNANRAKNLYERKGLNPEFLKISTSAIGPHCFPDKLNRPNHGVSKFNSWIPSRKAMVKAGFSIDGYWPKDKQSAYQLAARVYRPNTKVVYGSGLGNADNVVSNDGCSLFIYDQ